MPTWVGVTAFFVLLFGVAAFIFIAAGRQRRLWAARPGILKALAARRGYQFTEQPGQAADLAPIRPIAKKGNIIKLELPAAVLGHSLDADLALFDIYTEERMPAGSHTTWHETYETFLTIRSEAKWPHFEFTAVSQSKPDSITGVLLAATGNLIEGLMQERGLTHVPIPDRPGCQLFVGDPASSGPLREALIRLFDRREGWWIGAMDDAMTFSRRVTKSAAMGAFIPADQLDRFIDEAMEIERALRGAIAS